ncbi:MAG TPA: S-layer homology domain-containing protein, partial [Tissierellaceae bacterium]
MKNKVFMLLVLIIITSRTSYAKNDKVVKEDNWFFEYEEDVDKYYNLGKNKDINNKVTRGEFTKEIFSIYKKYKKEIPEIGVILDDVDDPDIISAVALGIASGVGENKFEPDREITREESFVIINNLLKNLDIKLPVTMEIRIFKDSNEISFYAQNAIQYLNKISIVKGVANVTINPKGILNVKELVA